MARNITRTLTTNESAIVASLSEMLYDAINDGNAYDVLYVKANGETGNAIGEVIRIQGDESTLAITVETTESKGRPTTVNVRNIISVEATAHACCGVAIQDFCQC